MFQAVGGHTPPTHIVSVDCYRIFTLGATQAARLSSRLASFTRRSQLDVMKLANVVESWSGLNTSSDGCVSPVSPFNPQHNSSTVETCSPSPTTPRPTTPISSMTMDVPATAPSPLTYKEQCASWPPRMYSEGRVSHPSSSTQKTCWSSKYPIIYDYGRACHSLPTHLQGRTCQLVPTHVQ